MFSNRRERRKAETRAALISAGIELIMAQGYDAVTVSEIARVADYGRSTFYLHFEDKERLVWAILEEFMVAFDRQILAAIAPLQSPQREWVAWQMIFAATDAQRHFYRRLDGDLSRRLRQWQKDHLIAAFERQLGDGTYSLLLDVPPEIGARFIVGAILEILDYWLSHPEQGDARTMACHLFRLVFRRDPPPEM